MSAVIFDGKTFAKEREGLLAQRVSALKVVPRLGSVVFREDAGGLLYTRLKMQAAVRVGIEFDRMDVSIGDSLFDLRERIWQMCQRKDITGVLVQKPMKTVFEKEIGNSHSTTHNFSDWWKEIAGAIDPKKDVDCLTLENLEKVYRGKWQILPATVKAVVDILAKATNVSGKSVGVVGRSDIVGRPLAAVLKQQEASVKLLGSKDDLSEVLPEMDVVVSATGVSGLIRGEMIKEGAVVIDVGAPKGDVEFEGVVKKAAFITPVPGGVGPVTVLSLLENVVGLV